MSTRTIATAAMATVLLALTPVVQAQTASSTSPTPTTTTAAEPSERLVARYADFAGSLDNATELVQGLQSGASMTLRPVGLQPIGTGPVTFTPATSSLAVGEVNIALSLAQATLAKAGITSPTPAQLQAALNGGSVTAANGSTVSLSGVLAARAAGTGWGQVANAMGVKLGSVVSASKTDQAGKKEARSAQETERSKSAEAARAQAASRSANAAGHAGGVGSGGSNAGGNAGGGGSGGNNGGGNSGGSGGGKK